ncbi:MAG: Uncharacterised protein [Flavobacteriia bacterium]|nr:MAG: Uncharacterised protein [Flavobacteriia bacterium]
MRKIVDRQGILRRRPSSYKTLVEQISRAHQNAGKRSKDPNRAVEPGGHLAGKAYGIARGIDLWKDLPEEQDEEGDAHHFDQKEEVRILNVPEEIR